MRIELRILSGARAGQTEVFDQPTILVGRQMTNDLRFDTHADLDVSATHAEIRERSGRFYVIDNDSTNGTYVNGVPVRDSSLKDGDVIAFGRNGPTVEVRAKGDPTGKTPAIPRTGQSQVVKPAVEMTRRSTTERVAIAVREQTRGMKTMLIGSMIGLGTLAIAAYWFGHREASIQVADLTRLVSQSESTTKAVRDRTRSGDTSFANALTRHSDSLRLQAQSTAARGNEAEITALKAEIERTRMSQQGMVAMDFSAIASKNDNAIAFLVTQLDDTLYGGTAFCVMRGGLMVTNRHNVRSATTNAGPTRLEVQFANSATRLPAHVVKISDDSTLDLALIQIDQKGEYPTVAGVNGSGEAKVGAPLVTIGFPHSLELPQQGNMVKTTLSAGWVSKHLPTLLQIDTYGTHGSSGAPVFDVHGNVLGVVWGGPSDAQGRMVYAVPSDRLAIFLGEVAKSIVR